MSEPIDGHDGPYPAPFVQAGRTVLPDWIDYNGHMNVGYYTFAFDAAVDGFLEGEIGVGAGHAGRQRMGPYTVQNHLHYLGELRAGAAFHVEVQLLDHDARRVHVFMAMIAESGGSVAASAEQVLMNVDLDTRRPAPWPDWAQVRLARMAAAHADLPRPKQAGTPIGIRRKV